MTNKKPFIVDSHCHLNYEGIKERIPEVIASAKSAGVELLQTICTRLTEFEEIYELTQKYDCVWASAGIHPHEADNHKTSVENLLELAKRPKTIGIGETGLDYFYKNSSKQKQIESFEIHIEAASESKLPIIIHTRDAEDDTYNILKNFISKKPLKGLLHCFTGSEEMAKKCMDLGFYISISGIVTFKNASNLQELVKNIIPLDRLMVETDAPFLSPIPFRGKVCEPAYTRNTAEFISGLKNIELYELAEKTTNNFLNLFDKVKLAN
jgi:TatD DNase family protein